VLVSSDLTADQEERIRRLVEEGVSAEQAREIATEIQLDVPPAHTSGTWMDVPGLGLDLEVERMETALRDRFGDDHELLRPSVLRGMLWFQAASWALDDDPN
jgi:hypothetical protein